jgi:hypothetical protein
VIVSWLDDAVLEGLQRLLTLRLKDSPALDTIELLADTWIWVFKSQPVQWDERLDAGRIRRAFLLCAGKLESWPAPKTVLSHLPSRVETLKVTDQSDYAMPNNIMSIFKEALAKSEQLTEEQRRALVDRELAILESLLNK